MKAQQSCVFLLSLEVKAMKLNIGRLRKDPGAWEEFEFTIPKAEKIDGLLFVKPVQVNGRITNTGDLMNLHARVKTGVIASCDRCLDEVKLPFEFEFNEKYCHKNDYDETLMQDMESEIKILEDDIIDLYEAVKENLILNVPMRILCAEDCPGLCPHCGQNLKTGKCNCHIKEVDSRLAVLAKLIQSEN